MASTADPAPARRGRGAGIGRSADNRRRSGQEASTDVLLVLDGQALTRDCLVEVLVDAGLAPILAAADIDDALARLGPDTGVKAAFINLPASDCGEDHLFSILAPLRAKLPECPVVVRGSDTDAIHVGITARLRVQALLDSTMPLDLTLAALRFLQAGWAVLPSSIFSDLARTWPVAMRGGDLTGGLTSRQREVLEELRTGMSNKAIACTLSIRERTVKAHVGEIMRRLGMSSRGQIVAALAGDMRDGGRAPAVAGAVRMAGGNRSC